MSEDPTHDLMLLVELFKGGGWREIRVETDDVSILFSTDTRTRSVDADTPSAGRVEDRQRAHTGPRIARNVVQPEEVGVAVDDGTIDPTWHVVTAPNLGTFYRSPKPGSPPFVEVGQRVSADAEICLIEVMKLFTSVKAGVAGMISRIDAADAELVEGGQTLFHIEPE